MKDASLAQVPEDPVEDTELQLAPRLKWDGSVQDGGTGLQILHYLMTRTGLAAFALRGPSKASAPGNMW